MVDAGEAGDGDAKLVGAGVEVAASGVERLLAQEALYFDDGGAMVQGVHGEGVPQGVDKRAVGDLGSQAGCAVEPLDEVLDLAGGHSVAGGGVIWGQVLNYQF